MVEEKVTWGRHVEVLQHRGEFGRTYHMELATFEKLVEILRPAVTLDATKSSNSTQGESMPIYPELVVAVGLRWLGGGKYCDIRDWSGMSRTSFYRVRDLFFLTPSSLPTN